MHRKTTLKHFDQFDDLNIPATLQFIKLSKGSYHLKFQTYTLDDVQIIDATSTSSVLLNGNFDKKRYGFHFMKDFSLLKTWQGMQLEENSIAISRPGDEVLSHTAMSYYAIVVTQEFLQTLLTGLKLETLLYKIHEADAITLPTHIYHNFLETFKTIFFMLNTISTIDTTSLIHYKIKQELPSLIINAFLLTHSGITPKTSRIRDIAFDQAMKIIYQSRCKNFCIRELCEALNISERTLRYTFQQKLHMTPLEFLKAYRLNAVYQHLRGLEEECTIKEVSQSFGFNHQGQFAKDYYNLMHEYPQDTLKRKSS